MNYNEFAEKIKAKYPEYNDMDNMELAKKIVNKYPNDYNDVTFDAPQPKEQPKTVINTPTDEPKEESKPHLNNDFTESHILEGGIEKRVTPNWDEKGRVFYTDENGNRVELQKAPLGTRIKNWGIAKADNIGNWLNSYSYDPNGNAPVDKMYRDKSKVVAALATMPFGGMGAEALGLSGLAKMATAGVIDGGVYGLSSGLIDKKDAKGVLGETVLNAGLGGVLGLGIGAATPYAKKVVNFLGEKASPIIKNVAEKLGNKSIQNPKINQNFGKELDNLLNPKDTLLNPNKRKAIIGDVSDETLKVAQENNIDLTGYIHIIDNGGKNHIKNSHMNAAFEIKRGQIPITEEDLKQIPNIIYNPDNVEFLASTKSKPVRFRYTKQMDDGTIGYIEFAANKQKQLKAKTMYKKARANYASQNDSHLRTSETHPSNNIITQNAENFKSPEVKTSQLGQSEYVNDVFGHSINKDYEVLTNKELIDTANEEVTKNANSVYADLSNKGADENIEFSALDFEKGRQLLSKLYSENRVDEAVKLTETLTRKGTQAGQAVQAMSLWSKTTPEGAEMLAQRIINKYNDAHPKKPIALTKEKRLEIRNLANNIQQMPEGYDKDFATANMLKEISDLVPKSFTDKFRTLRNISLLLNFKTFNRNLTGNAILGGAENLITKPLASGIDKIASLATGKRSRVTTQGLEYLKGMWEGVKRGNKEVLSGVNTRNIGARYDLTSTRTFKAPVLKQLEIATDWSLRVPDSAFYQASFEESLINQIRAEMINNGVKPRDLNPELIKKYTTPKMVKQATEEALEAVYQNNGYISDLITKARRATRGKGNFGWGDVLLPYAQTPANVAEMGLNYSPYGFIKGGINLAKKRQRQGTLDVARGLVGTGLGVLGYGLAKNDFITQNPENTQERLNMELLGQKPNTIKIGDNYYSFNQIQPLASSLAAGSAIANKSTPLEATDSYLGTVLDTSMMRGIQQLIEDNERYGTGVAIANGLLGLPSQLLGTGLNQVNAYIDPIQRETYDPNPVKRTLNYMGAKIPGLSKNLPAKYNLKGEEKLKYESEGIEKAWDVFANPIFKNKSKNDIVVKELIALKDITGKNVLLPIADKKVKKADNLKLSGEQYSKYQQVLGEKTYEGLEELINSIQYLNADDERRAELVKQRQEIIKAFVDEALFKVDNKYKPQPKNPVTKVENKIKTFDRKINKLKTIKLIYDDLNIQNTEPIIK